MMNKPVISYMISAALAAVLFAGCAVKNTDVRQTIPASNTTQSESDLKKAAQQLHQQRQKEIQSIADDKKLSLQEKLNTLRSCLAKPEFTERVYQEMILSRILDISRPFWGGVGDDNHLIAANVLVSVVNNLVKTDKISDISKRKALEVLAYHYCDRKMFREAENAARQAIDTLHLSVQDAAQAYIVWSNIYRYQDKYEDAVKILRKISLLNPQAEKILRPIEVHALADLALHFDKEEEAEQILDSLNDTYDKLMFYDQIGYAYLGQVVSEPKKRWQNSKGKALALQYVKDLNHPGERRTEITRRYLLDEFGSPETSAARRSLAGIPAKEKSAIGTFQLKGLF